MISMNIISPKYRSINLSLLLLNMILISLLIPEIALCEEPSDRLNLILLLPSDAEIILPFGPRTDGERKFHYGVDIRFELSEKVLSPVSGQVVFSGFTPAGSGTVTIRTYAGYMITILQLKNIRVRKGDEVNAGFLLGEVDATGDASTRVPHIHLSVRDDAGRYLDPYPFIDFLKKESNDGMSNEKLSDQELGSIEINLPVQMKAEKREHLEGSAIINPEKQRIDGKIYEITPNPRRNHNDKIASSSEIPVLPAEQITFLYDVSEKLSEKRSKKAETSSRAGIESVKSSDDNSHQVLKVRSGLSWEKGIEFCENNRSPLSFESGFSQRDKFSEIPDRKSKMPRKSMPKEFEIAYPWSLKAFLLLFLLLIDIIKQQSLLPAEGGRPIKTVGR
jgi:hypothetical protein